MSIIRKEFSIPSKTGITDLFIRCWMPDSEIKAAFQITHGMAEHGERYEEFAGYLCDKGFAVFVDDHAGHGKSVKSDDDLGYFGESGGWNAFVEDEKSVTDLIKKEFPDKPIIFYGHSMGSFIGREYIKRYGSDPQIKGAIISGTSGNNPAASIAIVLAGAIAKIKGSKSRSGLLNTLAFGAYNKQIPNPRTEFDWLTHDDAIVDKYVADKYCGFLFTAAGFKDLFTILSTVSSKNWFSSLDKDLPVLLVAGEEDPVGSYGKGVKQVYNDMVAAGCKNVTLKLYPGMRHEVHNEIDRPMVYEDLATWAVSKL